MNKMTVIERNGNPRFDVAIDGRKLQEHFVGRGGVHPSQLFALGWNGAQVDAQHEDFERFLARRASTLLSGRVPVLVCEECGDIGCGAIAVRIEGNGSFVSWSDWAFENGYEPARPLDWSTYPKAFQFDLTEYEEALTRIVLGD
jgi:hypothetical protein